MWMMISNDECYISERRDSQQRDRAQVEVFLDFDPVWPQWPKATLNHRPQKPRRDGGTERASEHSDPSR